MGVFVSIAVAIGSAVAAAATFLATILVSMISFIAGATAWIIGNVMAGISAVIGYTVSSIYAIGAYILDAVSVWIINAYSWVEAKFTYWAAQASILKGYIGAFLEAIHFYTLLKIHNLGMIFSKDYRDMINRVYREISDVFYKIGMSKDLIIALIQDARNVIMDAGSLMGWSYDIGEISYLKSLNGFLTEISPKLYEFKRQPYKILTYLADNMEKPAVEAKRTFMGTLVSSVDGITILVDKTATTLVSLRDNVESLSLHLPEKIGREFHEWLDPVLSDFDDIIENEYRPAVKKINAAIDIITDTQTSHTDRLGNLTRSILNPGDLMSNIDKLPELERLRQEMLVSEISNREAVREGKVLENKVSATYEGLKSIFEAVKEIPPKPPYYVKEIPGPVFPPGKLPRKQMTWFVGDF